MSPNAAPEPELICRLAADSRVKVVGLGGVGCIVLQFLAVFLKSLDRPARLALIDGDRFEAANAARMAFHAIGNKAEVKTAETLALLDGSAVAVVPVPEYVTVGNVARLIPEVEGGDHVVFLCVDNHPTRKLVSDHCDTLNNVVLISGGNDGVDPPRERGTYGNVQVAIRRAGRAVTAPLTRYHPEIANPKGKMPTDVDCGTLALSMPQILFTNLAVASAMLNAFFAFTCERLAYQEVKLDILDARMLPQFPLPAGQLPGPLQPAPVIT
jgi:hypothetical protein